MNLLVIDARSRDLRCWMASATQCFQTRAVWKAEAPLVLRYAAEIGSLHQLVQRTDEGVQALFPGPVLVLGSYQAVGSAGFTETSVNPHLHGLTPVEVYGILSPAAAGLVRFGEPITGVLLSRPVKARLLPGQQSSNCQTAAAARAAGRLLPSLLPVVTLAEGQSDRVRVWKLEGTECLFEFPEEHQPGFGPADILRRWLEDAVVPYGARHDAGGYGHAALILRKALRRLPWEVQREALASLFKNFPTERWEEVHFDEVDEYYSACDRRGIWFIEPDPEDPCGVLVESLRDAEGNRRQIRLRPNLSPETEGLFVETLRQVLIEYKENGYVK